MAGTVWPTLVAGARAKASEVESKFDWIEGDIVPMSGGTKTDATYDLGQSAFRFRDGYVSRQWLGPQGSVGTPAYSFQSRTTDGWYSPLSNQMGLALAGVQWLNHRDNSGTTYTDGGQSWTQGIAVADSNTWKLSVGSDLSTVTAMKVTTAGEFLKPIQPAFYATVSPGLTISSAVFTVTSYSEDTDIGSDFSTGVFMVPVTGIYNLSFNFNLNQFPYQGGGLAYVRILGNASVNPSFYINSTPTTTGLGFGSIGGSANMALTAGERMYLRIEAATTSVSANITSFSFFSGYLLG